MRILKIVGNILLIASAVIIMFLLTLEVSQWLYQKVVINFWDKSKQGNNRLLKPEYRSNPKQIGLLEIPKIDVKKVVLFDGTPENLDFGPCLLKNSAYPGTIGLSIISGHRVTHGGPFRNIDKLIKGNDITFKNSSGSFTYKVVKIKRYNKDKRIHIPQKVSYPKLMLTACSPPYSARYRIAVIAERRDFIKR